MLDRAASCWGGKVALFGLTQSYGTMSLMLLDVRSGDGDLADG